MELNLSGKTAFVSGSTAGIGFAIACALAKEGVTVTINGPLEADINQALNIAKKSQLKITGIAANLETAEGIEKIISTLPKVDILINNLGFYEPKDFFDLRRSDWQRIFNINVMNGIELSQQYLPIMLQKKWGRILFISSESGVMIPKEMIHYGITKTMQIALANGLAQLTLGTEVTVNSILAGPTKTPGVEKFILNLTKEWNLPLDVVEKKYFTMVRPGSLLQRFTTAEEIANLALYLVSPKAIATNGAAIRADGGLIKSIL